MMKRIIFGKGGFMDFLNSLVGSINDFLWTYIIIVVLVGSGLWFTLSTGLVQLRALPEMVRLLAGDLLKHRQCRLGLERSRRPHDQDDRHGLRGGHDVLEVLLVRGGDQRDVQALPRCGSGGLLGSGCARACRQVDGSVRVYGHRRRLRCGAGVRRSHGVLFVETVGARNDDMRRPRDVEPRGRAVRCG